MRILILSILIFISSNLFSQDTIYGLFPPMPKNGVMPRFKGGETALYEFLVKNIKYPEAARLKNTQGRVFVNFIVEKDGSVSNVTVYMGIGDGCDEEAMRVVRMMDGMWEPGTIDGKPVRVGHNLPVKFTLTSQNTRIYDGSVAYNKGLNLMKEEKYDKALSYFSVYKPGDKLYPEAIYASGMCKYMQSDVKSAVSDWESAKSAGIYEAAAKLAEGYFKLGNTYQEENKHSIAITCYTKSLENMRNDVNVLYNRGISYLQIGEKEKACDDWQRVRDLGSEDSSSLIEEYCK